MISLDIKDIKIFMSKLLKDEIFDEFLFIRASVETDLLFEVTNIKDNVFFNKIRPTIFDFLKGKELPPKIKFVLAKPSEHLLGDESISMFLLNIVYYAGKLRLTTAVSLKDFTTHKPDISIWNNWVTEFLEKNKIQ